MALVKKCRHGRGKPDRATRLKAWKQCGCRWTADLAGAEGRLYIHLEVNDYQSAVAAHARLVADKEAGLPLAGPAGSDIRSVGERWLVALEAAGRKPRTVAAYATHVAHMATYFGMTPVGRIRGEDIDAFRAQLTASGRNAGYVSDISRNVVAVLHQAKRERIIETVPQPCRQIANLPEPPVRMSMDDCLRVAAALPQPWRDAAELVLLTGLRQGELMALTPRDIDFERGLLTVNWTLRRGQGKGLPKTHSSARTIKLGPQALDIVKARARGLGPDDRLWPGSLNGTGRRVMRETMERLGVYQDRWGWHQFRHAAATLLDASGTKLRPSALRLGHGSNLPQTMRYGWSAEAEDVGHHLEDTLARIRHQASRA